MVLEAPDVVLAGKTLPLVRVRSDEEDGAGLALDVIPGQLPHRVEHVLQKKRMRVKVKVAHMHTRRWAPYIMSAVLVAAAEGYAGDVILDLQHAVRKPLDQVLLPSL